MSYPQLPGTPQQGNQPYPQQQPAPSQYGLNHYNNPQQSQPQYSQQHYPQQLTQQQPYLQQGYGQPQPQYAQPWNGYGQHGPLVPQQYMMNMQRSKTITTVVLIISSILLAIIFAIASLAGGGGTTSFFLALIPLSIVVGATFWIGRWDPEPGFLRVLAFIWGAVGSILLTFFIAGIWEVFIPSSVFTGTVIQAPVVEEFAKGLFVLAMALFFKKYMSSPIDGVVYMMLAAGGFAFTENILYFMNSAGAGGVAGLGLTFLLRGVMSPFAHALFSLPMGILLGLGVRKNKNPLALIGLFGLGYFFAMLLHALWNGSSMLIADMGLWFLFYAVVQIPLFVGAIFIIRWLRGQEAVRTYKYLTEYAWNGWFTPEEVATFGTWSGRKYILHWGKTRSTQAYYLVKNLNKEIVELADAREDIVTGVNVQKAAAKEQYLLGKVDHDRKLLARM